LLAILGIMVRVLVVGVLVLGIAVNAGCHGCEFCLPVPGTQQAAGAGSGHITVSAPGLQKLRGPSDSLASGLAALHAHIGLLEDGHCARS